jgi:hypothetical protein
VKAEWLEGYDRAGITFRSLSKESVTWWDRDLVELLVKHGPQQFRRAAIWDKDWDSFARELGFTSVKLSDPRSIGEKLVHRVLNATQAHRTNWIVRALERCLRSMGW